jgi:hypothetical protein
MKTSSISLAIKKIQIKTIHIKKTNIKKTNTGQEVGKKESSYIVGGSINLYSHYEDQSGNFSKKTKNRTKI